MLWGIVVNADKVSIAKEGGIGTILTAMRSDQSHKGVHIRGCKLFILFMVANDDRTEIDAGASGSFFVVECCLFRQV